MDRDFFISLCLATHRVANLLSAKVGTPIKLCANAVLLHLILVSESSLNSLQKKVFAQEALQELQSLENHFQVAKAQGGINPLNFSVLEREYAKVKQFIQGFVAEHEQAPVLRSFASKLLKKDNGGSKSLRARKILELLDTKRKAQVWELQKVMPEVTKRTLRRDLDALVQQGFLERKGEWNTVFYELVRR